MKIVTLTLVAVCSIASGFAQSGDSLKLQEDIFVLSRHYGDSVKLRWAPGNYKTWSEGNQKGYSIERYTMVRNNVMIVPERKTLVIQPMLPDPLDSWANLISINKYAAIAAQALFGEEFSVNVENTDAVTIANKVRENDQRFSLALLSADLSPIVAKKSALSFCDTAVRGNEKYLYRIVINSFEKVIRGSVFVNPADSAVVIPPKKLEAETRGRLVELKWSAEERARYVGFYVERSSDSLLYETVGDIVNVTLSPASENTTRFNYASDSIPIGVEKYYYRIRGVDSFGEISPPSNTTVAIIKPAVLARPRIVETVSHDNKEINIVWELSAETTDAISGFRIERGSNDKSFEPLHDLILDPAKRNFLDQNPLAVSYYRVAVVARSGETFFSFPHLATLIDSIPPSAPDGLKAVVDPAGRLDLSWTQNGATDLYGYRVYKSNNINEEGFQMTSRPIAENSISEQINLTALNKHVFYTVVAIDRNQNQSALSAKLKVKLPDIIKPLPPIALPCLSDSVGVTVRWIKSSSADVQHYEVYRAESKNEHRIRLKMVPTSGDTLVYKDIFGNVDHAYRYNVVAIDSAGNGSIPSSSILGKKISPSVRSSISWRDALVNSQDGTVLLTWEYPIEDDAVFKIYKSIGEAREFTLYKTVQADGRQLKDRLVKNSIQYYRIMAVGQQGRKSKFSEEIKIQF